MANPLDNAIQQHLLNFKANAANSLISGARPLAPQPQTLVPPNLAPFAVPGGYAGGACLPPGQPAAPTVPGSLHSPQFGSPPAPATPLPQGPLLSVAIDKLPFRYTFSDGDLKDTFQKWGPVLTVQVIRDAVREVGVVRFEDEIDAADAQRQLQGHTWNFGGGASGTLAVVFGGPEKLLPPPAGGPPLNPMAQTPQTPGGATLVPPAHFGAPRAPGTQMPQMMGGPPPMGGGGAGQGLGPGAAPGAPFSSGMEPGSPPPAGQMQGAPPSDPRGQPPGPAPLLPPLQDQLLGPSGAMPKSLPVPSMPPAGNAGSDAGPGHGLSPAQVQALAPAPGNGPGPGPGPTGGGVCGAPGGGKGDALGGKGAPAAAKPVWSAKIIVQSEALRAEFPTMSKIVGANNANVEHVRSQTHCDVQLRGRGSGFMEAESGRELQENMFMWLTCAVPDNGKAALDMCQDLLKSVYEEYQGWCSQHNLASPPLTDPVVIENPESVASPQFAQMAPAPPMPDVGAMPPMAPGMGCDFYGACKGGQQDFRSGPYQGGGKGP